MPSPDAAKPKPVRALSASGASVRLARIPTRRSLRWALATPMLALVALILLMGLTIAYLTQTEESQRQQSLARDVNGTQRSIRERLQRDEEAIEELTRSFAHATHAPGLRRLADNVFTVNPSILFVAWVDRAATVRGVHSSQGIPRQVFDAPGTPLSRQQSKIAFDHTISSRKPVFSEPFATQEGNVQIDLHTPILRDGTAIGSIVISYSLPSLLLSAVPAEVSNRVAFSLIDVNGNILAQTRDQEALADKPFIDVPFEPLAQWVTLRGHSYLPTSSLYNDVILTLIAGLIALAAVSQFVIWRNTRQRAVIERELADETAFRRAMENSMSTGMRVIDLSGNITYVNPAFCRMVGFDADELTGCTPPFPYWPPESREQLAKNLQRMLSGESPPSGLPIQIMRKDGSRLTVRMYTSPLIDQSGQQTGWMTSVTDISEQTRIRQELAQAQERFITVLQALDAAVSVATVAPQDELLFANQAYRKWFGASLSDGHRFLCDSARGPWSDVREVFNPIVQRWFEVRVRRIQWVDARPVELMVATDITQERANEQAQREQHERLQQTSRLVTMGEMASSLAHELNQPLTAIANYTSGATARIRSAHARNEQLPLDEVIEMLEKTARQAERAGQVIRRIRSFVKRSDPIRKPVHARTILADTLGLAEIEARELGLEIAQQIEEDLPVLNVDAILIEQVLLNLIKNGLEAMSGSDARKLEVSIGMADQQVVFSVKDRGHGVPASIRERLFDSFYTTKTDGMGMGLNICRSIIESHQGRLWFEDNPDGGCTFRFTLPFSGAPIRASLTSSSEASES